MHKIKYNKKDGFYHIQELEKKYPDAQYYMVFGEKSNGKTYTILQKILYNYVNTGKQGAVLRRWDTDFRGQTGKSMFASFAKDGIISDLTDGQFDDVIYYGNAWTLCTHDEKGKAIKDSKPFCFAFALNTVDHMNGVSFPDVTTVLFDEFMSRHGYLTDEFVSFEIAISNIVRQRTDVKIYMMGNSVNKECIYFREMGLNHIFDKNMKMNMKQGDSAVYQYGDSKLQVAVEYAKTGIARGGKPSDVYFAFDNPALNMITEGGWMMSSYPHKPCRFNDYDIKFIFFIQFHETLLQCEVVRKREGKKKYDFIFVHPKTTELQSPDTELIFDTQSSGLWNYSRKINQARHKSKVVNQILSYFNNEKVFVSDNSTGEVLRNYLIWCNRENIFK